MGKLKQLCLRSVNTGFALATAAIVILILLNAANHYVNMVDFNMAAVLLFLLFAAALTAGGYFLCEKCGIRSILAKHPFLILTAVMLTVCIAHILIVRAIYTPIGWDVAAIINAAGNLHPEETEDLDIYFTRYPNNVLMTALFKVFFKIVQPVISDVWLSSALLSVLAVDIGIVLISLTAKRVFGLKVYYLTLWLSLLLIAVNPTIYVPYSDAVAMPFTACFLFSAAMLLTAKTQRVKFIFSFMAGLFLFTGYYIKPTVLIAGIAVFLLLALSIQKIGSKRILTYGLCVLLLITGGLSSFALNRAARPLVYSQLPTEQQQNALEVPVSHFIMMGLNEREGYYGFFQDDVNNTFSISGKEEKTAYHKEVIVQRLQNFGVWGFLKHCINKAIWVTTDGTFLYGGEGIFHNGTPKKTDGLAGFLQNFNYTNTDLYQNYFGNYMQAIWLLTVFGMALLLFRRSKERPQAQNDLLFIMQMAAGGLVLFLVLFEARSRYLFLYLPYFTLLAAVGYQTLFQRLRAWREKS